MGWKVWLSDDESLLCSLGYGVITSTDVIESANTLPNFRPGLDRLTIFDKSANFSSLDFDELKKVHKFVRSIETLENQNGSAPFSLDFKVAYVCSDEMGKMILNLYNDLWDEESEENGEYKNFSTIDAALLWLERPDTQITLPTVV